MEGRAHLEIQYCARRQATRMGAWWDPRRERQRSRRLALVFVAGVILSPSGARATVRTPSWFYPVVIGWFAAGTVGVVTDAVIPFQLKRGVPRGTAITGVVCWSIHTLTSGMNYAESVRRGRTGLRTDGGAAGYFAFSVGSLVLSAYATGRPPEGGVVASVAILPGSTGPVPAPGFSARF